jgi:hypothetical protein
LKTCDPMNRVPEGGISWIKIRQGYLLLKARPHRTIAGHLRLGWEIWNQNT